jgi:hypothetical protein
MMPCKGCGKGKSGGREKVVTPAGKKGRKKIRRVEQFGLGGV